MSKLFDTVRILHIEPTDVCQAACYQCPRETDTTFDKSLQNHLSMEDILNVFGANKIAQLDKMFMCGNYGDPAAGKNTLYIYKKFREINPDITLGMNTNGALRNPQWWKELASITNQTRDYVVFSVDGLEDTNHLYRRNVDWDKLIENATAYIQAGGNAHWDMLVYHHNEHQVDQAQELAQQMGFKWFRAKVSKRSSKISWLQPPKAWSNPVVTYGSIDCFRNKDQSLYIDAQGRVYPCCWLGFGKNNTIDKFEEITATWNTDNCNLICKSTCSSKDSATSFTNQWQREVSLC